jgi:hypothetical protein
MNVSKTFICQLAMHLNPMFFAPVLHGSTNGEILPGSGTGNVSKKTQEHRSWTREDFRDIFPDTEET